MNSFQELYDQMQQDMLKNYLAELVARFKEHDLNAVIHKIMSPENIYIKVEGIPMRLMRDDRKNYNNSFKMYFQAIPVIVKHCPEFGLYSTKDLKQLFNQDSFWSVDEVADRFKEKDLKNKLSKKVRSVANKTGMFEHLSDFSKFKSNI
jgi:hypothetical protein